MDLVAVDQNDVMIKKLATIKRSPNDDQFKVNQSSENFKKYYFACSCELATYSVFK